MNKNELEERLINYSVLIIEIVELLPNNKAGITLENQLIRSRTSPALNYGEAQSAESKSDFIHKIKVILKELRESFICLKIIERKPLLNHKKLAEALTETNELISIFVASVKTALTKPLNQKSLIN